MRPLLLTFLFLLAACSGAGEEPPLKGARLGGPFTLTDQNGKSLSDTQFAGRYRLVYFGYSYCPDVCPMDLQTIGQGLARFEKTDPARGRKVQPVFITVDPQRDTPPVIKEYVAAFHPRLIGLTGTPEQIEAVKKSFGIFSSRQASADPDNYLVDHSRQALLMGPQGEPIALVPQDEGADAVAAALDRWVT